MLQVLLYCVQTAWVSPLTFSPLCKVSQWWEEQQQHPCCRQQWFWQVWWLSCLLQRGVSFALGEKLNRGEGSEKTKLQMTVSGLSWVIPLLAEELKAFNWKRCMWVTGINMGGGVTFIIIFWSCRGEKAYTKPASALPRIQPDSYSGKAIANKRHEKGKETEGPNLLFPLVIPNNHDSHDLLACSLQWGFRDSCYPQQLNQAALPRVPAAPSSHSSSSSWNDKFLSRRVHLCSLIKVWVSIGYFK